MKVQHLSPGAIFHQFGEVAVEHDHGADLEVQCFWHYLMHSEQEVGAPRVDGLELAKIARQLCVLAIVEVGCRLIAWKDVQRLVVGSAFDHPAAQRRHGGPAEFSLVHLIENSKERGVGLPVLLGEDDLGDVQTVPEWCLKNIVWLKPKNPDSRDLPKVAYKKSSTDSIMTQQVPTSRRGK